MRQPIDQKKKDVRQAIASRVVKALFESDKRIRYCAIIGEKGDEIVGGMRHGIKSLEPERASSRLRMQTLIGMALNRNWNDLLGDADYIIAHRTKVMLFIFPLSGIKSLLISAEPGFPLEEFRRIADIARGFPKEFG
jgi:hypothetical protein